MDTTTTPQPATERPRPDGDVTGGIAETRPVPLIDQPTLPFADSPDEPIPYRLTARARRTVAPDRLPPLRVVDPAPVVPTHPDRERPDGAGTDLDDPTDTRGARARALRRAGFSVTRIAEQLEVDPLIVRAWVGDVVVPPAALRRALQSGRAEADAADASQDTVAFELARAAAREEVGRRLGAGDGFAAGLGVAAALADIDHHAVTIVTGDAALLGMLVRWLQQHLPTEIGRLRLVLRLDPEVSGDLERHRWAQATGLPQDLVASTRRRPTETTPRVQGMLRIADPTVAATLAGWRDALLEADDPHRVDAAF